MPLQSQLHVDKLLGEVSVKYQNSEYIAQSVFPVVPVKKESDLYRVYQRNFRVPETKYANKGKSNEHLFDVSNASYVLERHGLRDYISNEDEMNYDMASLRSDTVEELTDVVLRRMEKSVADLFTSTSWSLGVSLGATLAWNANTTISNPIPVMDTAQTTVIANSGFKPNFGVVPRSGFIAAKNHISVLDRVKYTSVEMSEKIMAGLFDLPELFVPTAQIDTSNKGATEVIADLWPNNAFVGYKPQRPSPLKPSSGYIFQRSLPMVRRWRDEDRDAEGIEVRKHYVAKVVGSLTGYLIKDIT